MQNTNIFRLNLNVYSFFSARIINQDIGLNKFIVKNIRESNGKKTLHIYI